MTQEELLAKLHAFEMNDCYDEICANNYKALRAVVELHRPEEQDHKQYDKCWNCNLLYPCPTIQAIEKELS